MPLKHPKTPSHDNYIFELWQLQSSTMIAHICQLSYVILLLKLIMADLPLQMHQGIYIMGCIWQPFWNLQVKVGISFYFWIIRLVNSQLALYSHVRCISPNTPKILPHDNYIFELWQLQSSTMIAHIVQVSYVILLLKLILSDLPPKCTMEYIYYGMYLAAILDSSRKGGNFLLFLNN